VAVPAGDVDHLILAKAERRLAAVDRQRHQPVAIAALRRLVANPVRIDRAVRPQDDDHVGGVERLADRAGELRPALDQRIPPHEMPGLVQRIGQLLRDGPVGTRIAQKQGQRTAGRGVVRVARHGPTALLKVALLILALRQGGEQGTARVDLSCPSPAQC
jgi:hypothetical protein